MNSLHSRPIATPETCKASFHHDAPTEILSLLIVVGLIVSYLPQHYRIIHNKSSEGFSPFFLLLGSTSSAASLLAIITLQWGQITCCQYLTTAQCFESTLGVVQVAAQWFCFNLIFVLYLFFYPLRAKYVRSLPLESSSIPTRTIFPSTFTSFFSTTTPTRSSPTSISYPTTPTDARARSTHSHHRRSPSTSSSTSSNSDFDPRSVLLPGILNRQSIVSLSPEYRLALSLFLLTILHLFLSALATFILLWTLPNAVPTSPSTPSSFFISLLNLRKVDEQEDREHPSETAVRVWAMTCGIESVVLGVGQYFPQLWLTLKRRLVGSLSLPMMFLQVPGSFVFVYTLAVRPGIDWTGYATYLVSGVLQSALLTMCLLWKRRQKRLGIDDYGKRIEQDDDEVDGDVRSSVAAEHDRLLG